MSPEVRDVFARVLTKLPRPSRVLEVGATRRDTLLTLPSLQEAERHGINPDPREVGGEIRLGSGWRLPWPDRSFDLVLCNSVLEHDAKFWLTLAEMRRCLAGHLVIGVPAFVDGRSTILGVHRFPKDYYRFGADAVREVFFEGLALHGQEVVLPQAPRIVAWGSV